MCDMGYLIADHVTALMQVVTNELPQYTMQVITTKCLNTAVMVMYLFLGRSALEHTEFCDVSSVRRRRALRTTDPSQEVWKALMTDALEGKRTSPLTEATASRLSPARTSPLWRSSPLRSSPTTPLPAVLKDPPATRVLYYIMITNGTLKYVGKNPAANPPTREFPGHVFVIEKLPRGTFNLYQSYISHFKLNDVIRINSSYSLSHQQMKSIMHGVKGIFDRRVWDVESTKAWEKLSHVSEKRFEGYMFGGNVLTCYSRKSTDVCINELRTFVHRVVAALVPVAKAHPDKVYGDHTMYDVAVSNVKPMTNSEMLVNLSSLQSKL